MRSDGDRRYFSKVVRNDQSFKVLVTGGIPSKNVRRLIRFETKGDLP